MKRILLVMVLGVGLATAAETDFRVATVDLQMLFRDYHKAKDLERQVNIDQARVNKEASERRKRIDDLKEKVEHLRTQLNDPTLAESKLYKLRVDHDQMVRDMMQLETELQEWWARRRAAVNERVALGLKQVMEEIRGKVVAYAKLADYDYIFDKSGASTTQVPLLLYSKDAADITDAVLKVLNDDEDLARKK